MKPRFPLFARLLFWFFLNVIVLLAAWWITLRVEFGPQYRGFLPDSSRPQTQAMARVLIGDLAKLPRDRWDDVLTRLGAAYRMQFALFDSSAERIAGAQLDLPEEARSMIIMTGRGAPPPGTIEDAAANPPPRGPNDAPLGEPPPRGPRTLLPDFPQRVLRTDNPQTFWLLVHLPMDRISGGALKPAMLVGATHSTRDNPLFFNPSPWIALVAAMVVFSALFWAVLTRSLTRAIGQMTRATEAIAEGQFDMRVAGQRGDELGRLGFAINRMAERLKGFITGQRRFLGDAAHELCSPLARMEVALGILERHVNEQASPYLRDVRDEVAIMQKLAHELLSFTKASLGEHRLPMARVPVAEVAAAAVEQEQAGGRVTIDIPTELSVWANRELLLRALANLVRNAVRYAGGGGAITITAVPISGSVTISVSDSGPGVPAAELARLFDPFYRPDESRTSETGGTGLGLAIVKTCVEACQGTVTASNRTPHGLEIQIRCPAAPATGLSDIKSMSGPAPFFKPS